jgi:acyl-CoA synthetase
MGSPEDSEEALSLARVVARRAEATPDAFAYLSPHDVVTWRDYHARSQRLARLLQAEGFAPGDRVAVMLPDGPGVHAAFLGNDKAGVTTVGIGPRAGYAELRHLLSLTRATGLITREQHRGEPMRAVAAKLREDGVPLRRHLMLRATGGDGAKAPELATDETIWIDDEGGKLYPALPETDRDTSVIDASLAESGLGIDDWFLLNSTSGTTGMPKCVRHTQRRWRHFHELAVEAGNLDSQDVFLSALPAPFGFGIWTGHVTPTLLGVPTVVHPQFSAEDTLAAIERHSVTVLAAVSTQFIMLLNAAAELECSGAGAPDLSSLRVLFTGGEAVPYERAAEFEEQTGACVLQFYGSNETGALSRTTLRDSREKRLRTAGRVIPEMQVRLFDESGRDVTAAGRGQPGCKGPLLSAGYEGDDDANANLYTDDGWMLVGDMVEIDDEAYLRVIGRTDDFIIRGGKNISGPGVEQAVATHPAVALAAAVAVPDPVYGERVCVFVELRPGTKLALAELCEHMRSRGSSVESLPERLEIRSALPRASGGKVAKQLLRDEARRWTQAVPPNGDPPENA